MNRFIFAAYAESVKELRHVYRMAESLRTFGGQFSDSPVWAYIPQGFTIENMELTGTPQSLNVEIRTSRTPEEAQWFYYSGKVYAAAEAEAAAAGKAAVLIWMDEDTVVLSEPSDFDLQTDVSFAYCPVMHNRSGSRYDQPPDDFWSRIYDRLSITDELLFPVVTPADQQKIRAYFQAGLLVVRPERGILRGWADNFELLYTDSVLVDMCRAEADKRIFLHQTALVGAVLKTISRDEMLELSNRYNYPIFFEQKYDSHVVYDSLEDIITIRCEITDRDSGRKRELSGPPDKVAWLKGHLQLE